MTTERENGLHVAYAADEDDGRTDAPAPGAEESEDAAALELARRECGRMRYCTARGWMDLDGHVWRPDTELHHLQRTRELLRLLAPRLDGNRQRAMLTKRTADAVLSLARSDGRLLVPADQFDSDPDALNTPGGIVDLTSGSIRAMRPADLVSRSARVAPTNTPTPTWDRFLVEVFQEDREAIQFIQVLLGYILTGLTREQKLFFFRGNGANGKSTLLDLMTWLMGDYALKLPAEALMQSRFNRHPAELAQLLGIRLAVSSELESSQYWAESRIKELTGDETLTARFMRQDFFTFRQTQKHVVAGNYRPRLKGGDDAMRRRMVLVPFEARFEGAARDQNLPAKLKAEAGGILAWIIDGATEWYRHGLHLPERIVAASADYMTEMDDLEQWAEDVCELHPEAAESASTLYQSFAQWKRAQNEVPPSLKSWREQLLQRFEGLSGRRTKRAREIVGICLTAAERRRLEFGEG